MRDIDRIISALGSPVRREILRLVWDRELPAGDIAAAFEVSKPTISQHLAVLREAGLVTMAAVGTSRLYRAKKEALAGLHGALEGSVKWEPADAVPERALSVATTKPVVVVSVDVDTDQETTFAAFTDEAVYARWLGAPVRIRDGRFAATMEWGTEVRGRYLLVSPPDLIVMRWDFEHENVPVPGGELTGYLWVSPAPAGGSHVEVHQLVDTPVQAEFMKEAWATVLGRLRTGVVDATDPAAEVVPRRRRTKRGVSGPPATG
ncbi:MAG TPA: metalloregulator ArsR/SmtB family transcription factor [Acidimicrobiales bacterium]|nr:metalloregulator ArsR/SmtB family transcription factor [Acidimicrobiales bacterium]